MPFRTGQRLANGRQLRAETIRIECYLAVDRDWQVPSGEGSLAESAENSINGRSQEETAPCKLVITQKDGDCNRPCQGRNQNVWKEP